MLRVIHRCLLRFTTPGSRDESHTGIIAAQLWLPKLNACCLLTPHKNVLKKPN
jgi:hypothetical protein